jgi:hypothetical protein
MTLQEELHAWSDESGNSGLNLFDAAQPTFWSATLLSPFDLDSVKSPHAEWLASIKAKELHGNKVSFGHLNKIADSIRLHLEEHACRFVLTRIDKAYHAITTFVTMVFDSDVNEAVAPLYDHVPIFRKVAAKDLARIFLLPDLRRFWTAYTRRDLPSFCRLLLDLEQRARELLTDKRAAELICEAMCWARIHPERIMEERLSEGDAPNMRALLLLVDGIHKLAGPKARVVCFRHDEQSEFEVILREDFDRIKNAFGPLGSPYAPLRVRPAQLFTCQLEMVSSSTSLGLQLIDILLYLMSRHLSGSYVPREDACGRLLNFLGRDERTIINQIVYSSTEKDFTLAELEAMALESSLFKAGAPLFNDLVQAEKFRRVGLLRASEL